MKIYESAKIEHKPKVLIVDDDLINLEFISEILRPEFELAMSTTGEEALALIHQFKPEVVLLDLMMPGIDGYEVCRNIRDDKSLSLVKIILVTARALLSEKLKGYEAGADDYLTKPFEHEELLAKTRVFMKLIKEEKKKIEGSLLNFTDRKKAEEQLKKSLREKETLLQELYHRTKNNMQVIISMLQLQAVDNKNKEVKKALKATRNKIQAMALVHQKLYQSMDLSSVNMHEYIAELTELLLNSSIESTERISLVLDVEKISILIDTAIPCGLILNELIANSLNHAFPDNRQGEIKIRFFKKDEGNLQLEYADNGIGVPGSFDFRKHGGFGIRTAIKTIEFQLQGEITFETENGFACQIRFRDDLYTPRV